MLGSGSFQVRNYVTTADVSSTGCFAGASATSATPTTANTTTPTGSWRPGHIRSGG